MAIPPCRHAVAGCESPASVVVYLPDGCYCWPDPVQALCRQHLDRLDRPADVIFALGLLENPEAARPTAETHSYDIHLRLSAEEELELACLEPILREELKHLRDAMFERLLAVTRVD